MRGLGRLTTQRQALAAAWTPEALAEARHVAPMPVALQEFDQAPQPTRFIDTVEGRSFSSAHVCFLPLLALDLNEHLKAGEIGSTRHFWTLYRRCHRVIDAMESVRDTSRHPLDLRPSIDLAGLGSSAARSSSARPGRGAVRLPGPTPARSCAVSARRGAPAHRRPTQSSARGGPRRRRRRIPPRAAQLPWLRMPLEAAKPSEPRQLGLDDT